MSNEFKNKEKGFEHGKYTKKEWEYFLNEANKRIETQNSDINDQNSTLYSYEKYDEDLIEYMRGYEEKYHDKLNEAYSAYNTGKSGGFFEKEIQLMDERKIKRYFKDCKILVVTANPIEKAILHYSISKKKEHQKIKRFICGTNVYYMFKWGKYWVAHVHQHHTGANTDLGMNTTIHAALKYIKPNVIFSLGVGFEIDYKTQNIGGVLVSRQIFPYSENKIDGDKIKPNRWQDKTIDNWLDVRFANANGFLDEVTYGGILSGGSVLSSSKEKDKICTAYFKDDFIIGGEMEGSGLFQTSYFTDIPCAVIKGICDWGVAKNDIFGEDVFENEILKEEWFKDSLQAYAMLNVIDKCEPLFRDGTLFSSAKNMDYEREKKKSKILLVSNLIAIIFMLIIGISISIQFSDYMKKFGFLLITVSIICILLTLTSIFKKNACAIDKSIRK